MKIGLVEIISMKKEKVTKWTKSQFVAAEVSIFAKSLSTVLIVIRLIAKTKLPK